MTDLEKVIRVLSHFPTNTFCAEGGEVTVADVLVLLKAQEPVEPIENAGFYYCGACRYAFTSARQKYCSECGRAVKWDD